MGFAMRTREHEGGGPNAAIGIDLGTAFSRVGVWKDGDVLIIPNDLGRLATPSCVAFTEHCVLVGEPAAEQADCNLENTIFAPQRLIGARFDSPIVQWYRSTWPGTIVRGESDQPLLLVNDLGRQRKLRPEEVVTMLIENLRKSAERYLGVPATEAVVTVPAQYGQLQCDALLRACTAARLRVHNLIKAPTAAAIAFCLTNPLKGRNDMLICDIGASYFDFTLLSVSEEGFLVERAIGSDVIDLDDGLVQICKQDIWDRFAMSLQGKPVALMKLRHGCEVAKRKLSQWTQARIDVSNILPDDKEYAVSVSRGHFEDACRIEVEHLLSTIDWCLEDCGLDRQDVEVLLVGGCARMPLLRRATREFFHGRAAREVLRPDHAAVLGAAVYVAALLGPVKGSLLSRGKDGAGATAPELPGLTHFEVHQVHPWATFDQDGAVLSAQPEGVGAKRAVFSGGGGDEPAELPDELGPAPALTISVEAPLEAVPRDEGFGRLGPLGTCKCRASGPGPAAGADDHPTGLRKAGANGGR